MSRAYLTRTAGNFGDDQTFNLQEEDGTKSDLSGQTAVKLQARYEGDIPGVDPLRIDGTMSVVGPETDGKVKYDVVAADYAVAGLYFVQVEATFTAPARKLTWDVAIVYAGEEHG